MASDFFGEVYFEKVILLFNVKFIFAFSYFIISKCIF